MKTMIATSKIRPDGHQTVFPPFGSLAIIQRLIDHGFDNTYLFDIDGIRPTDKEIKERLINDKPDVVGISGVVSTAYVFIKKLVTIINDLLSNMI